MIAILANELNTISNLKFRKTISLFSDLVALKHYGMGQTWLLVSVLEYEYPRYLYILEL